MTWFSHFSFKSEPFLFPSIHYEEFFNSGTEKKKYVCRAFQKHSDSDNLLAKTVKEHIVLVDMITVKLQRWYFCSEYKNHHVFHVASWNHSPRYPLSSLQHRKPGCAFANGFSAPADELGWCNLMGVRSPMDYSAPERQLDSAVCPDEVLVSTMPEYGITFKRRLEANTRERQKFVQEMQVTYLFTN